MTCLLAVVGWLLACWYLPSYGLLTPLVFTWSLVCRPLADRRARWVHLVGSANRARCWLGLSQCSRCGGTGWVGLGQGPGHACPCTWCPEVP